MRTQGPTGVGSDLCTFAHAVFLTGEHKFISSAFCFVLRIVQQMTPSLTVENRHVLDFVLDVAVTVSARRIHRCERRDLPFIQDVMRM